ncbi:hypothetical protein L195_g050786 [Trifolium pratense]|uniref:Uncharacterized protein n=1 Tax=Trifolium pratense TaxID=57577 RepID=A0A2K3JW00_TRIPR|nr:hypothetical protein L195_g050786 [Trifolium pratense]
MQSEEEEDKEKYNAIRRSQEEVQCNQKKSERSTVQSEEARKKCNAIRRRNTMQSEEVGEKCNQKKAGRNAIKEKPTYQQRKDQPKNYEHYLHSPNKSKQT